MLNFIYLAAFHIKLYAKNSYFVTLLFSVSTSMVLLQYIVTYGNNINTEDVWIRSGIFGMWAISTTAAGYISFQKYQGTLPYLLNNPVSDKVSLLALLLPITTFGLLAFPISYILSFLLGMGHGDISLQTLGAIAMTYTGSLIVSFIIAGIFIFTRDAIIYEQIINIPLLLLSGIFGFPIYSDLISTLSSKMIPMSSSIQYLLGIRDTFLLDSLLSQFIWLIFLNIFVTSLVKRAKQNGKVGKL